MNWANVVFAGMVIATGAVNPGVSTDMDITVPGAGEGPERVTVHWAVPWGERVPPSHPSDLMDSPASRDKVPVLDTPFNVTVMVAL